MSSCSNITPIIIEEYKEHSLNKSLTEEIYKKGKFINEKFKLSFTDLQITQYL